MLRTGIAVLLLAAWVRAQSGGTVEGRVVSTSDGSPVRKATVLLRAVKVQGEADHESYVTDADASGRFHFAGIAAGSYECVPSRNGFEIAPPDRTPRYTRVTVAEGQPVSGLVVRLTPLGAVGGRVLDPDGQPVAEADVIALQYAYPGKKLTRRGSARTDDRGEFRLFDLYPGTYYILATPAPENTVAHYSSFSEAGVSRFRIPIAANPVRGPAPPSLTATWFPSAADVSQARAITVPAGGEAPASQIHLQSRAVYSIRGKAPARISEGPVLVERRPTESGHSYPVGMISPDGTFEVSGIPSGSYVLTAMRSLDSEGIPRASVEVTDHDVEDVQLVLAPAAAVSGVVKVAGKPEASAAGLPVHVDMADGRPRMAVTVRANGTFKLPPLPPDVYRIGVGLNTAMIIPGDEPPPSPFYVTSIRLGDQEVADGVLDLRRGGAASLTIMVSAEVGGVSGRVIGDDGTPVAAALVTLIPEASRPDRYMEADTDSAGRFVFEKVKPGRYTVFGWADIPQGAAQDPDFRKPFEKLGTPVTIEPESRQSVDLKLIDTAKR